MCKSSLCVLYVLHTFASILESLFSSTVCAGNLFVFYTYCIHLPVMNIGMYSWGVFVVTSSYFYLHCAHLLTFTGTKLRVQTVVAYSLKNNIFMKVLVYDECA